ncbi:hypothetical protein FQA39_LY07159 [Lamprigera yunnana]|nr:hypothetical protein FQA39_LY07159 [Lamprigera yunnana]
MKQFGNFIGHAEKTHILQHNRSEVTLRRPNNGIPGTSKDWNKYTPKQFQTPINPALGFIESVLEKDASKDDKVSKQFSKTCKNCFHSESFDYQFWQKSIVPTMHFQSSLPRLPIPKLEDTCQRYLNAQLPLLSKESFKNTEKYVVDFKESEGKALQALLKEDNERNKRSSYISKSWFDMYLRDRKSLPINYNPALIYNDYKNPKYNTQLLKCTNLIVSSLRFYKSLQIENLEPEVYHMNPKKTDTKLFRSVCSKTPSFLSWYVSYLLFNAYPLDMSQYHSLFNTSRLPQLNRDSLYSTKDSKHIIVQYKGNFYVVNVLDADTNILPAECILGSIKAILENEIVHSEFPLGILTTLNRDDWGKIRRLLLDVEDNRSNIDVIDSALFNVCLDENDSKDDPKEVYRQFLHSDGTNRWFDKSFSLVISKSGTAGINFEHSWGDGVAVLRYFQDVYKDSEDNPQVHPNTKPYCDTTNLRKLEFKLDDYIKNTIKEAMNDFKRTCGSLNVDMFKMEGVGKKICKKHGVSPDAIMQLGFQVTYYKLYDTFVGTYESCSTAAFKHGRTETIRPCTMATKEYCLAIESKKVSYKEMLPFILHCSKIHSQLTKEAAMGQGFDRHLFALKLLAKTKIQIFEDAAYEMINHNIISTSTLASSVVAAGIFGPVVSDGFGIAYSIRDDLLGAIVTSYSGRANGNSFNNSVSLMGKTVLLARQDDVTVMEHANDSEVISKLVLSKFGKIWSYYQQRRCRHSKESDNGSLKKNCCGQINNTKQSLLESHQEEKMEYDSQKFLYDALGEDLYKYPTTSNSENEATLINMHNKNFAEEYSVGTSNVSTLLSKSNNNSYAHFSRKLLRRNTYASSSMYDKDFEQHSSREENTEITRWIQEAATQHQIIFQISKALNFCLNCKKFRSGVEYIEAEKILLVAIEKREAALKELKLTEYEDIKEDECVGFIKVSNITVFLNNVSQTMSNSEEIWFFVLVICGPHIFATEVVRMEQKDFLSFKKTVEWYRLSSDFEIKIKIYSLTVFDFDFVVDSEKFSRRYKIHIAELKQTNFILSNVPKNLPSGDVEYIEAEKILLVAIEKREAALKELKLTEYEDIKEDECVGFIKVSNITVFLNNVSQTMSNSEEIWFFVLVICGPHIFATEVVRMEQKDFLSFKKTVEWYRLSSDFEIKIKIYSLTVFDFDFVVDSEKETVACPVFIKLLRFNKNNSNKRSKRLYSYERRQPSFSLVGATKIHIAELKQTNFILSNVPKNLPIKDNFALKISSSIEFSNTFCGFLTIGSEAGELTTWNRQWCYFTDCLLKLWNYPQEQEFRDPNDILDLSYCVLSYIHQVEREMCAKSRTLLIETAKCSNFKSENSFLAYQKSSWTITRYYLSADTDEEMKIWQDKLNRVIFALRNWNCMKCPLNFRC